MVIKIKPFNRPLFLCLRLKMNPKIKKVEIDNTEIHIPATLLLMVLFVFKIARIKEIIIPNEILIIKDILKLDKVFFILIT